MGHLLWIFSRELFEYQPLNEITEYLEFKGNTVILVNGRPIEKLSTIPEYWDGPAIGLVSIQWARWIQKNTKLTPGVIFRPNEHDVSVFSTHWYKYCINEPLFIPWGQIINKKQQLNLSNKIFVRSNSSQKVFPGMLIDINELEYEINSLYKVTSVNACTMMAISSEKRIYDEWRFWIIDRKIVCYSGCSGDIKKQITDSSPTDGILNLLNEILKFNWLPDIAFTIDLAETDIGPRIVEPNALSTSGLYKCDWKLLIDAVAELALNEYIS